MKTHSDAQYSFGSLIHRQEPGRRRGIGKQEPIFTWYRPAEQFCNLYIPEGNSRQECHSPGDYHEPAIE